MVQRGITHIAVPEPFCEFLVVVDQMIEEPEVVAISYYLF